MFFKYKKAEAAVLLLCLLLSLTPYGRVYAKSVEGTALTITTPVYFLVKEEAAGRWLGTKNYIHYINFDGVRFPAYCVESSKMSPVDGTEYFGIGAESMKYTDVTMSGLREILRNGYPYTTAICGYDFGTDTVKAQAATQAAVRMWLSYRKEQENAAYNVFGFWNPSPKKGQPMVKAGTAEGAAEVYAASIALFSLAKSGKSTTIAAAYDVSTVSLPSFEAGSEFVMELKVKLIGCEYATLSVDCPGAEIVSVSEGTEEAIANGASVRVRFPYSAAGRTVVVLASAYSTKANSSLRFYAEDTGHRQRLFVGRTDLYGVQVTAGSLTLPTPTPTPEIGPVQVSKKGYSTSSDANEEKEDGTELKGARLQILDSKRNVVFEWVTDGKAKELDAVLTAGETYILHEVEAPAGYLLAADQTFTVHEDGSLSRVVMEDKPTRVEISKKSALDGSLLKGAKLQIFDGNTLVYEWVTDGKPRSLVGKLTAGKTYRLHEAEAPKGYLLAEDVSFTVSKTDVVDKVEMVDRYTRVLISKISLVDGEELSGATLRLEDSTGAEIATWVTDGSETELATELIPGETYTLRETEAPEGYLKAEPVSFVYGVGEPKVTMMDAPTIVYTSKKDRQSGLPLAGAHLQILDEQGRLVEQWVSNENSHMTMAKLAAGRRYILHEQKAPEGYRKSEDVTFYAPEDEEPKEIVFYNAKLELPSPKTGDRISWYILYGVVTLLLALGSRKMKRRNNGDNGSAV